MAHQLLFTFAVVGDTHVNPSDDVSSSPWEVNRLANPRSAQVVRELNDHELAFVVHVGDMVHPVPSKETYDAAAERFHAMFSELRAPLHVVPGNHDVGDKPLIWSPAEIITEEFLVRYERHFGSHYYSFDHDECHFIVLNAQLFNTGFAGEGRQRRWLEDDLLASREKRIFVFLHYPIYLAGRNELSHYDNVDEPARSWLLDEFAKYQVEAVFSGHVHNFFYDEESGTDRYVVPSISFVRLDYSEFARVAPADEAFGRNDVGKLGYLLVDVYADDHSARIMRTHGRTADDDDMTSVESRIIPASLRKGTTAPLGVDLRHRWTEIVDIPYSGGVDEFYRKRARNDYSLMALWELGIRELRVPLTDLLDDEIGARVEVLGRNGFTFLPFTYGLPDPGALRRLNQLRSIVDSVEVILSGSAEEQQKVLGELRDKVESPIILSTLHRHDPADTTRPHVHAINHGYLLRDAARLVDASWPGGDRMCDGFVFRVGWDDAIAPTISRIADLVRSLGARGIVQVRLAGESPAQGSGSELEAAIRTAQAVIAAKAYPELRVVIDTFLDHDRGYFPRTGLVDRRYNLRPAGHVVRNLTALLASTDDADAVLDVGRRGSLMLRGHDVLHILLSQGLDTEVSDTITCTGMLPESPAATIRVGELIRDRTRSVRCDATGDEIKLADQMTLSGPVLLTLESTATTS